MNFAEKTFLPEEAFVPWLSVCCVSCCIKFFCLQTEYTGNNNEIKVALEAAYFEDIFNGEKQYL